MGSIEKMGFYRKKIGLEICNYLLKTILHSFNNALSITSCKNTKKLFVIGPIFSYYPHFCFVTIYLSFCILFFDVIYVMYCIERWFSVSTAV